MWENQGKDYEYFFWHVMGVAESGEIYASSISSPSVGVRVEIPHHVISPTQRRPLTSENADPVYLTDSETQPLSRALLPGEEEIAIMIQSTKEIQIYKPNFGARFAVGIDIGTSAYNFNISPPHDMEGMSSSHESGGTYIGGYIAWTRCSDMTSYLLTPSGAALPAVQQP